ncbi:sigma-70 family RNA polymerase sigma factor [Sphingomonas sp.]|uniref:RNA polymerase sigma factor n=1 Tax=Sphingomonas sp. TaxID=28214 RepID=UPI0025F432AA|nr:sigma-70 family RNA polymerase sigma factor [Sphingomonas sp.]
MPVMSEAMPIERVEDATIVRALIDSRHDLVRFLTSRLFCRATAEDIAQDVFIRLSTAEVDALHPRRLIFRTAANLASNHCRDERRRAEIRRDGLAPEQPVVNDLHPERFAIARDALWRLAEELATWPARTREIFILNRYDGLTQREIGERLSLSSTSIERHLARAILKLASWAAREQA